MLEMCEREEERRELCGIESGMIFNPHRCTLHCLSCDITGGNHLKIPSAMGHEEVFVYVAVMVK